MIHTPFGTWSTLYGLAGSLFLTVLYLLSRKMHAFFAWTQRQEGPRERVGFYAPFLAVLGFVLGGFLHDPVSAALACKDMGKPVVECLIPSPAPVR